MIPYDKQGGGVPPFAASSLILLGLHSFARFCRARQLIFLVLNRFQQLFAQTRPTKTRISLFSSLLRTLAQNNGGWGMPCAQSLLHSFTYRNNDVTQLFFLFPQTACATIFGPKTPGVPNSSFTLHPSGLSAGPSERPTSSLPPASAVPSFLTRRTQSRGHRTLCLFLPSVTPSGSQPRQSRKTFPFTARPTTSTSPPSPRSPSQMQPAYRVRSRLDPLRTALSIPH